VKIYHVIMYTELFSRLVERVWLYHSRWKRHGRSRLRVWRMFFAYLFSDTSLS